MKKRRKTLVFIVAIALALTLLPTQALTASAAAITGANYTLYYNIGDGNLHKDNANGEIMPSATGFSYSGSGSTLTLSGFGFSTSAEIALSIDGNVTINLEGANSIASTFKSGPNTQCVTASGSLMIGGDGNLTATGINATGGVTISGNAAIFGTGGSRADIIANPYSVQGYGLVVGWNKPATGPYQYYEGPVSLFLATSLAVQANATAFWWNNGAASGIYYAAFDADKDIQNDGFIPISGVSVSHSVTRVAGNTVTGFKLDNENVCIAASVNVPYANDSLGVGDIAVPQNAGYLAYTQTVTSPAAITAAFSNVPGLTDDYAALGIPDTIPLAEGAGTDFHLLVYPYGYGAQMPNMLYTITANRADYVAPPAGGGSVGGGGSAAPLDALPANGGSVSVNYTKSGGTVNLDIPVNKVTEIINKATGGSATFDLSKLSGATKAVLPEAALTQFVNAKLGLGVKLPQGAISLDAAALKSVAQQAGSPNVSIELKQLGAADLNAAQKSAVKDGDMIIDVNIYSGEQKITSLKGELTIAVSPYDGSAQPTVWYLNEAGGLEQIPCVYDAATKTVTFTTDHLSIYVLRAAAGQPAAYVNPFADVAESAWYFNDVRYVYENGLMSGTDIDMFSPDMTLTRGMLVTALWRLRGEPMLADFQNPYNDVDWQEYYFNAVLWATASKVAGGYGDGAFGPGDPITRQDLAVILLRYMDYMQINLPVTQQWIIFADGSDIADYAMDAMQTFNKLGVVNGTGVNAEGQTIISPKGDATRAQAAAMLNRFAALIGGNNN